MRLPQLLVLVFMALSLEGYSSAPILIEEAMLGESVADRVGFLHDEDHDLTVDSILARGDELPFQTDSRKRKNFRHTTATTWVNGTLRNEMKERFYLHTARSITNVVELYLIENGKVVKKIQGGDHIPFDQRPLSTRKNVFPIDLSPGEEIQFLFKVKNEGESLVLPFIVWTPKLFHKANSEEQIFHGLFYGILIFVCLIFGFFYLVLQDRSFLYYVLYIFFFGLLQFSIDGYSYRFFFDESPWMADRILLFSSSLTILLLVLYARTYLKTPQRAAKLDYLFKGSWLLVEWFSLLLFFLEPWQELLILL